MSFSSVSSQSSFSPTFQSPFSPLPSKRNFTPILTSIKENESSLPPRKRQRIDQVTLLSKSKPLTANSKEGNKKTFYEKFSSSQDLLVSVLIYLDLNSLHTFIRICTLWNNAQSHKLLKKSGFINPYVKFHFKNNQKDRLKLNKVFSQSLNLDDIPKQIRILKIKGVSLDGLNKIPQTVESVFFESCKIKSPEIDICSRKWVSLLDCDLGDKKHITGCISTQISKSSAQFCGFHLDSTFKILRYSEMRSLTFENCTIDNIKLTNLPHDVKIIEINNSKINKVEIAESVEKVYFKNIYLSNKFNLKKVKSRFICIDHCIFEKGFDICNLIKKNTDLKLIT